MSDIVGCFCTCRSLPYQSSVEDILNLGGLAKVYNESGIGELEITVSSQLFQDHLSLLEWAPLWWRCARKKASRVLRFGRPAFQNSLLHSYIGRSSQYCLPTVQPFLNTNTCPSSFATNSSFLQIIKQGNYASDHVQWTPPPSQPAKDTSYSARCARPTEEGTFAVTVSNKVRGGAKTAEPTFLGARARSLPLREFINVSCSFASRLQKPPAHYP